ncbi:MAG: T9SS type A sorting domain-containing protein [Bacteroidota bacterium]
MHLLLPYSKKFTEKALIFLGILALSILFPFQAFAFAPIVDLGPDTVSCGNPVVLDAGNTGATFNWSTGESTQSITVSNSGTYWVDVTDGNGTSRDSIEVSIFSNLPTPVVNDTSICLREELTISIPDLGDGTVWYDSISGGSPIGSGSSFTLSPNVTTNIYPEYFHFVPARVGIPDTSFGSIRYVRSTGNGIRFKVETAAKVNAVYTFADAPVTFELRINDGSGALLMSKSVTITTPLEKTRIPIGMEFPRGEDYTMTAHNYTGSGSLAISFSTVPPFPYTIPGAFEITSSFTPFPNNRFHYFFDWEIEIPGCSSPRGQSAVTVLPTPSIDLGSDTIICQGIGGPLVLDATNAGANYLWQDGSTNPTLTVTQTDTFSVIANIGNCVDSDEIAVFLLDVPNSPLIADSTICGPQEINLSGSINPVPEYIFWRDEAGTLLEVAPNFNRFLEDTFQLSIVNVNSKSFQIGAEDLSISGAVRNDGLDTRGIKFDAFQDLLIRSLAVFPISTQNFSFDIVVLDSNRIEIGRYPQALTPPYSKEVLTVNIFVEKGNGYTLEVQNRVGGNLLRNDLPDPVYPFVLEGIAQIPAGTSLANTVSNSYNYLYDLEVVPYTTSCRSTIKNFSLNVNVPLNMEDSIYSCTDFVLDPGVFAANYLWNTNSTSSSIPINETGMYVLTADDGANCTVTDSTFAEIPQDAGLPPDGVFCGDILETNYGVGSIFNWSTGATTPTIAITNPGTYSVSVQEPRGCVLTDTIIITAFDSFPIVDLGTDQSVCESLLLDAGNPGLTYAWSTGETTQQITISSSGLYSVIVSNANNCTSFDTIGVLITPLPESQFSIADTVIGGVSRRATFVNQSSFGSYLWEFGDGNTSTAISPTHTYADTGTYCVRLITTDLQNNCGSDTAEKCIVVLQYPVGTENEILGTELILYPNPASETLTLELREWIQKNLSVSILDLKGKLILQNDWSPDKQSRKMSLEVSSISSGIYILKIDGEGGSLYRKISIR